MLATGRCNLTTSALDSCQAHAPLRSKTGGDSLGKAHSEVGVRAAAFLISACRIPVQAFLACASAGSVQRSDSRHGTRNVSGLRTGALRISELAVVEIARRCGYTSLGDIGRMLEI